MHRVWWQQGPMQWPVLLRLPDAVQDICIPAMFICADHDGHFPERTRTQAQQVLDDKSPGWLRATVLV